MVHHPNASITLLSHGQPELLSSRRDDLVADLPAPENKRFYPALDGLRALAVLMVFFEHYEASKFPALHWGWAGVDVFFVLSGFLITGILYDTRETQHRFRNFYARRTLRIFPLYYAVLLVGVALTPVFHWLWNPAWILWFCYLGNYARFFYLDSPLFARGAVEHLIAQAPYHYLPGLYLGHFWSLCVEEQFYLVWPLVVYWVRDRVRLRNICAIVCCATLLARIACVFLVPHKLLAAEFLYRVTPLRADALLLGGLVALCLRGPETAWMQRLVRPILVLGTVGFFSWELIYRLMSGQHHFWFIYAAPPFLTTVGYTMIDLFSAALILAILQPGGALFSFFNLKWPRRLGQISYGFYVFHDIFHGVWRGLAAHLVRSTRLGGFEAEVTSLFGLIGTTVIAYFSYRYFETPFLRLKSRFTA